MKNVMMALVIAALAFAADDQAVRETEKAWAAAAVKGDLAELEKVLANDLVYTHSSARTENKAQFIDALRTGATKYESIDYDEMNVRVYGDTAVLNAVARVKVTPRGQSTNSMNLRLLHVFHKNQGRWQMVAHQSTRITP